MNKVMKIFVVSIIVLSLSAFVFNRQSEAATSHKVSYGETYWKIAKGFGIRINSLMTANHQKPLYAGETITLPNSPISLSDKKLLYRLVHAEAVGELYAGKVAVATVVLNRVQSSLFPNTVSGVIYQISGGHYAFTPVQDGRINEPADAESKKAVNEALALMGKSSGSLYFYNPATSSSAWILSRPVTVKIGHHVFAK
ncbi:cell wall hydrolase [Pullulanibacillus pueri]|nr:cell wall hydrolase [Pullulanibacillus pueri]